MMAPIIVRRIPRVFAAGLMAVVSMTAVQCAFSAPTAAASGSAATSGMRLPTFSHVFIIVMENREFDEIIGSSAAPHVNGLAQRYGLATNFTAETHPSLPNYIALTGGELAFADNCGRCTVQAASVVDEVEGSGRSWRAYLEDMPAACASTVVTLTQFDQDLNGGSLPNYVWVSPNNCHNMHDCGVATGDIWLSQFLPRVIGSSAFADSVVFLTWDEGSSNVNGGGRIATLIISPLVIPGVRSATQQNHYGLLRTVEDAWRVSALGNARSASVMSEYWR